MTRISRLLYRLHTRYRLRRLGFRACRCRISNRAFGGYERDLEDRSLYVCSTTGSVLDRVVFHSLPSYQLSDSVFFTNAEELEIAVIYQSLRPLDPFSLRPLNLPMGVSL